MKKKQKLQRRASFNGTQTAFAQRVYAVVAKIPRGKTMTYAEVAKRAGRVHASRAVGSVMGANKDKRVPCHRVIRSDGGMGGYAFGGPQKKLQILKREGAL
ncbi:MAG: MGMT family protein [Patescibacteria group bacterium]